MRIYQYQTGKSKSLRARSCKQHSGQDATKRHMVRSIAMHDIICRKMVFQIQILPADVTSHAVSSSRDFCNAQESWLKSGLSLRVQARWTVIATSFHFLWPRLTDTQG